ncbi:MAG TPA: tetratricopeptide repeat protein, partial [Fimbriimonadaceae bacterium]|nr:tetratricopeptide repeat protein [Fimbriimonadaceae bacterium]
MEALQRAPNEPNAYFNCGDLLYRCQQYQDAAHLYESGLRLKPDFGAGWMMLGNCLVQLSLLDGAKIAYAEALRFDPTLTDAAHNLKAIESPIAA